MTTATTTATIPIIESNSDRASLSIPLIVAQRPVASGGDKRVGTGDQYQAVQFGGQPAGEREGGGRVRFGDGCRLVRGRVCCDVTAQLPGRPIGRPRPRPAA